MFVSLLLKIFEKKRDLCDSGTINDFEVRNVLIHL